MRCRKSWGSIACVSAVMHVIKGVLSDSRIEQNLVFIAAVEQTPIIAALFTMDW